MRPLATCLQHLGIVFRCEAGPKHPCGSCAKRLIPAERAICRQRRQRGVHLSIALLAQNRGVLSEVSSIEAPAGESLPETLRASPVPHLVDATTARLCGSRQAASTDVLVQGSQVDSTRFRGSTWHQVCHHLCFGLLPLHKSSLCAEAWLLNMLASMSLLAVWLCLQVTAFVTLPDP